MARLRKGSQREPQRAEERSSAAYSGACDGQEITKHKGIVVFIDGDSQWCDRVTRALEVQGYHVLTAENPAKGAVLVRVQTRCSRCE
jgi:hypothetical protein